MRVEWWFSLLVFGFVDFLACFLCFLLLSVLVRRVFVCRVVSSLGRLDALGCRAISLDCIKACSFHCLPNCVTPSAYLEGPRIAASVPEPDVKRGSREDVFCIQNFGRTTRCYLGRERARLPQAFLFRLGIRRHPFPFPVSLSLWPDPFRERQLPHSHPSPSQPNAMTPSPPPPRSCPPINQITPSPTRKTASTSR